MLACTKSKSLFRNTLLGLLALGCVSAAWAQEGSIPLERFVVEHADSRLVEGVYVLDARISYHFNPDVMEALESGVPLTIELEIEIMRPREWMWNKTFTTLKQRYRLQYHALTQQYLLKNLNSDIQYNFPTRQGTLEALGEISDLPLLDNRLLDAGVHYTARLRADLDIESLPGPLRLLTYLSPQWRVQSEWYTWPLTH
ncbi:MAG: DUF4390 domain-containing protein [Gammaproteobacteria bacterium]